MKKFTRLLVGTLVSACVGCSSQSRNHTQPPEVQQVMADENVKILRDVFRAIEQRDEKRAAELFDPNFEIHWPASLPYGGTKRGLKPGGVTWSETWMPLQPTEAEREMDPRVIAANAEEVVVLWHQRGLSAGGDRFDGEVLGLYKVRDGKLTRAQMFYFDTAAVARFLAKASLQTTASHP